MSGSEAAVVPGPGRSGGKAPPAAADRSEPGLPLRGRRAERGSAVVGFALVVVPLVVLLLATVQAIAYLRLRDLAAAAAAQGARRGAAAGASTRDGGAFADAVLARSLPAGAKDRVRCTGAEEGGAGGSTLVVVRCRGAVPAVLPLPHPLLPIRVTARAVREGR